MTPVANTYYDSLFLRHYDQMVDLCRRRLVGVSEDPEDLVHAAYIKCRRYWEWDKRSCHDQVAYLYRAIHWLIVDASRHHRRRQLLALAQVCRPQATNPTQLDDLIVTEALLQLKGRTRQICWAILKGKTRSQICDEFRMSYGAVAVTLCRAKKHLTLFLWGPLKNGTYREKSRRGTQDVDSNIHGELP
jgi:RNA polymerase sigma factor (sigma-70 family)